MSYTPFTVGTIVTNEEMCKAYKIANMGGMRKSNKYKCLILISDHTKTHTEVPYEDWWENGILYYIGMGKQGDQVLQGNQNGTLYNSRTNGIEVHLFEVEEQPGETQTGRKYKYLGIVKLVNNPYQKEQPDENGVPRKVWVFPIKPESLPN